MDLELSKDQKMIKSAVREFLEKECPKEVVREIEESEKGHSEVLWQKMAELGWMGMAIPEEYGGLGTSSPDFFELVVLLEEMGYHLLLSPFFSTVILGALPMLEAGTEAQKKTFLPGIADGRLKFSLALTERSATRGASGIETEAVADSSGYKISGRKLFVENGHIADYLICIARTAEAEDPEAGITLFIVDPKSSGVEVSMIPTIGLERQCEVQFREVAVSKENMLGELNGGWPIVERALEKAAVAKCAEMLGGMEACLEMTNAYVKKRVQYGRTIGSFQVIQHYLANVWIDVATSRELVYKAASILNEGVSCKTMSSMAKAWVGKAFCRTTERCTHMHGAIGVTRECDVSLYYRQAKAWDLAFGSAENHLLFICDDLENG
jgi:alkylation response protein AidB-like acyl-CoA dehydrogenase